MKKKPKFKKGQIVRDKHYWYWGYGVVKEVLKTRIKVMFNGQLITVDNAHYQFLELEK